MESAEALVEKLRAPLQFAAGGGYKRLSLVKNLESVVTSLCTKLRNALPPGDSGSPRAATDRILGLLLDILQGFDRLPPDAKKDRLAAAMARYEELAALLKQQEVVKKATRETPCGAMPSALDRPLLCVRGIGPRISALLARKGVNTIRDLLYYLPHRYEDRRTVCPIPDTVPGMKQTVLGVVSRIDIRFYGRRRIFTATVEDGHGSIEAKWFKGREAFLRSTFRRGRRVILSGTVGGFGPAREMIHPDFEILDDHEDQLLHFKRIVPVYSETEGLPQKTIRRILWQAIRDHSDEVPESLPAEVIEKRQLIEPHLAIRQVHFPSNDQELAIYQERCSAAHRTLIYEELFYFELSLAMRRQGAIQEAGIPFKVGGERFHRWLEALPFTLTGAQRRVVGEIERNMATPSRMNRLLQGDVGSGKTVVAMAAMVIACENGYQCALLAPTELLAEQHHRRLRPWSDAAGFRIALLTGGGRTEAKSVVREALHDGQIDIVIGTHAMIQEGVAFRKLGLAIIDEQHRFGVAQRDELRRKGLQPDLLLMTATPIPRTLAMTVYGDLDVSVIDEMPPGKKPVRTKVFTETQRLRVYEIIRQEMRRGNQAFIVYPLVAESETLSLKDASHMAEHLQKDIFPGYPVGLVHGRMNRQERESVMADFASQKIRILVSTTVIEVGIDIPEATLMVIEHAERFGLSQLHQLRGRVGRSDLPSSCLLLTGYGRSTEARRRLRIMEETSDGFRIAEEDLAIRGPGEFLGTRQSGLPDFRVAHIVRDSRILAEAREDAMAIVEQDPQLVSAGNAEVRRQLLGRWPDNRGWARIA
jgi:ATP-dependent DNA helicase RecG